MIVVLATAVILAAADAASAQRPTRTPAATPVPAVPTIWSGDRPPIGLRDGAPSVEALIDRFLAALKAGDAVALHRLRLTKEEYTSIVVPGEVPKGQPPRATFETVNDTFFGMMDSRSRYVAQSLLRGYKDREFPKRRLELTEGSKEYAWYTAHGEVRLTLIDPAGEEHPLRTGWIAEVDGQFKFIGFNWDD